MLVGRVFPQRWDSVVCVRLERVAWAVVAAVVGIVFLGGVLIAFLPESLRFIAWVMLAVVAFAIVAAGYGLVSRGSGTVPGRYIWSRIL